MKVLNENITNLVSEGMKYHIQNKIPLDNKVHIQLKETFHRVIKGKTPLIIKIIES